MGGTTFETTAHGATAQEAYDAAKDSAYWESGHGGYTGTIAEKSGFVFCGPFPDTFESTWQFSSALCDAGFSEEPKDPRLIAAFGPKLEQIVRTYDDKWGPACCFKLSDDEWLFCGWASC